MAQTILKFLLESGVATSAEIIKLKNEDPKGFEYLKECARSEMNNKGIEIEEK